MYQPVVDLASGCCVGAEALARWQRDNGEWVGPNVFIPVAESIDLVPKITMAVLSRVVSDLPLLQALEPDLSINLNLSPQDLKSENFDVAMSRMLQQSGVPAHRIKREITESALVNSENPTLLVRKFRARGHKEAKHGSR